MMTLSLFQQKKQTGSTSAASLLFGGIVGMLPHRTFQFPDDFEK